MIMHPPHIIYTTTPLSLILFIRELYDFYYEIKYRIYRKKLISHIKFWDFKIWSQ